jgi:hypothetical protein
MDKKYTRYQPIEILQIIQANYKQQQQYDSIVIINQELNFDTTILEWREICDLVDTTALWKYLNYYFRLTLDWESWVNVLEPEYERTLGDLSNFIATYAEKEIIEPIKLFGSNCETAAIFKSLTAKLKDRGIEIIDIKPSSKLEPLLKKYRFVLIEEINQLAPSVLTPINYKSNWIYKWGLRIFFTFFILSFYLGYKESMWTWLTVGFFLIGYIMTWIGARLNPKQECFTDIQTVADLIRKIQLSHKEFQNKKVE